MPATGPATGSATRAVTACLDRIAHLDDTLTAMITVDAAGALGQAAAADAAAREGRWLGLLHGLPMAVKDNIDTAGLRTTSGSLFFAERVPNADAPVVARLKRAGAVILGKTTLHELAFGIRSTNPVVGQCRNPWSLAHVPGGSSGGSGAAVAAGLCAAALGTDTGGSIRLPAAMNGIAGLRPTLGRVPNTGCTPVSAGHDTIGPMARDVGDLARIFAVLAGPDAGDPVSVDRPLENFLPRLGDGIAGVRIGIPRRAYFDDAEPRIVEAVMAAAAVLEGLGARLVDVDVPGAGDMHRYATVIVFADACAFHAARLDQGRELFDGQTYDRMMTGRAYSAVDYAEAMAMKRQWKGTLAALFRDVDLLLSPTVPTAIPPIAEDRSLLETTRDASRNTYCGAFGELPGLSLPCGFGGDGLPVGLQLEAAWWQEPLLLRAGFAYQGVTGWHRAVPPLVAELDETEE